MMPRILAAILAVSIEFITMSSESVIARQTRSLSKDRYSHDYKVPFISRELIRKFSFSFVEEILEVGKQ